LKDKEGVGKGIKVYFREKHPRFYMSGVETLSCITKNSAGLESLWYGEALHQDGGRTPAECLRVVSKGLGP
jgi:hypothetical protein